jgi:hypothetical protein
MMTWTPRTMSESVCVMIITSVMTTKALRSSPLSDLSIYGTSESVGETLRPPPPLPTWSHIVCFRPPPPGTTEALPS